MLDNQDIRRRSPRIGVEAMCWELLEGHEVGALAVDLSSTGLRIERPFVPGMPRGAAPLQLEVPGIDEIMWARGEPCFDELIARPGPAGGTLGLVRRTGYRLVAAAARDLRMLADYVFETHRQQRRDDEAFDFRFASCYMRN